MTAQEILTQLQPLGSEGYCRVMRNHGVTGPLYGVKISELKKYEKQFKKNTPLALELYESGIYDAMYLAGLIADENQITTDQLRKWLAHPHAKPVATYAVAWVAADGPHAWELANEWINSTEEYDRVVGWSTLSSMVAVKKDQDLDLDALEQLLARTKTTIHSEPDDVRYHMNGFVISLGSSVPALTEAAILTGKEIGPVKVDMGNTACVVPSSPEYIQKVIDKGRLGKKRKSARC